MIKYKSNNIIELYSNVRFKSLYSRQNREKKNLNKDNKLVNLLNSQPKNNNNNNLKKYNNTPYDKNKILELIKGIQYRKSKNYKVKLMKILTYESKVEINKGQNFIRNEVEKEGIKQLKLKYNNLYKIYISQFGEDKEGIASYKEIDWIKNYILENLLSKHIGKIKNIKNIY